MTGPELRRLTTVTSTQDLLHTLAAGGAPAGTAIVAEEQTAGRGSRGRTWHSPRGGLWLSVLCRPTSPPAVELLSLRVGLAVAEAIETVGPGLFLRLKWPNDLLIGTRKAGGILCEARWHGGAPGWVAVGVGLNVANPIPDSVRETAVALDEICPGVTPESLAPGIAKAVGEAGARTGFLTTDELAAFARRDALAGRRIAGPVAGTVRGVSPDGMLLVTRGDGGIDQLRSGTVQLES